MLEILKINCQRECCAKLLHIMQAYGGGNQPAMAGGGGGYGASGMPGGNAGQRTGDPIKDIQQVCFWLCMLCIRVYGIGLRRHASSTQH
jgi:hypothetical protein